jgi:hypothetical protein
MRLGDSELVKSAEVLFWIEILLIICMRFEAVTAVSINTAMCWNVTQYSLVESGAAMFKVKEVLNLLL